MSIGVRRTMWMMIGELIGVAIVAIAAVFGVAGIMLNYPEVFEVLKWIGGVYLAYIGINMWRSKGKMSIGDNTPSDVSRYSLFTQGFVTAIANPKGWAFMISLLPPFISVDRAVAPQLLMLLAVIMFTEFTSMMAYATGGKSLRLFLSRGDNVKWMNRIAGSLMIAVGMWLAVS
jgi:threonine/homoserine/homoserine lactone efflux protein